jgi:UDP:flavonoid glycosyltransferase YjiC (YdhE family)
MTTPSATVLIIAVGTRGDVAPYTGLGTRLAAAGFRVAIATQPPFANLVTGCGLEYREIPGDPRDWLATNTGQRSLDTGPRAMASSVKMMKQGVRDVGEGMLAVAQQGADVALLSMSAIALGYHIAEGLGIPSLGVPLVPTEPTGDFPPPALSGLPVPGRWGNRTLARASRAGTLRLFMPTANEIRRRVGLPPTTGAAMVREMAARGWPILNGYSPALLPRPRDWRDGIEAVGFWWPQPPTDWRPSNDLLEFLAAGPPPVFVTLGSMAKRRAAGLGDVFSEALRKAGVRGVVQSGWAGMMADNDDQILTVDEVPYDWLFPRLSAVVHHCGVGTTGAGLRAGVPAVGVPVWLDQPFWARRLVEIGVSPTTVPLRRLSPDRLARAIRAAVDKPSYRDRAQEIAQSIHAEDGAGQVVEAVRQILNQRSTLDNTVMEAA